jgi:spore maturation protein CgeB
VLLATPRGSPILLSSYGRALETIGVDVHYWDPEAALRRTVKGGRIGERLNAYVTIDTWEIQASRPFVVAARECRPDVVMVCGSTRIVAGALAQIRASVPTAKLVYVWPDPLLSLKTSLATALPLYDLVATYSESSIEPMRRLGARDVRWVPFAADLELMPLDVPVTAEDRAEMSCDVAFIGNPRPERERAILALLDAGIGVRVWGSKDWLRHTKDPARARRYFQGRVLFGKDFVRASRCARLSLNVIDDTNFPGANMRFFELLGCGATQLASSSPEMQPLFPDDVAVAYFDGEEQLVAKARALLDDDDRRTRIGAEGHRRALEAHTYVHRAREILEHLGVRLNV